MNNRKLILWILIGIIILMAGITATVMLSSTLYMNSAADYARAHLSDLPAPQPLPGATPYPDPPVRIEAIARYGDANAVEVQVIRRYQTARHADTQFTLTYFYQNVSGGWQLASFPASFWGGPATTTGTYVTFTHPQRDQTLVTDLVTTIDAALTSACGQWQCPADTQPLHFTLAATAASPSQPLTVPAPQFTGVPLNYDANTDYQSAWAAHAVQLWAAQLGKIPADATAEIQRQNLYRVP